MQLTFPHIARRSLAAVTLLALMVSTLGVSAFMANQAQAAAPNWDTTGTYVVAENYSGTDYMHDMWLVQDAAGNLTGSGGNPSGAPTYMWTIDSGSVSGDTMMLSGHYTATDDASTTMFMMDGVIAPDGSMSGTWSDNYPGPATSSMARTGTWMTTSGMAMPATTTGTSTGTIGGTVTGGVSGVGNLAVTSIDSTKTTATADGTYENGWSYTFNITVPTNEQHLSMKFADWFSTAASSTIAAGGNMQISSAQADNAGAMVPITTANVYSVPALHMTGDMNPSMPGIQVQVVVQVKIPVGSINAPYTTNYGVQTLP